MERRRHLDVDRESFEVTENPAPPGQLHILWVSGPNVGYGSPRRPADGTQASDDQILAAIRDFLDQIDPDTGYVEEPTRG